MAVTYTDDALLGAVEVTDAPMYGRTASGYGSKIPTRYMLWYAGRRRRVYMMQYANAGSAYIVVNGQDTFLSVDAEYKCREAV